MLDKNRTIWFKAPHPFGPFLRQVRRQRHVSVVRLMTELGVGQSTYYAIEAGREGITLADIQHLARILHAPELLEAVCADFAQLAHSPVTPTLPRAA